MNIKVTKRKFTPAAPRRCSGGGCREVLVPPPPPLTLCVYVCVCVCVCVLALQRADSAMSKENSITAQRAESDE
jgi:hypothetical protein